MVFWLSAKQFKEDTMPRKIYRVKLTKEERNELKELVNKGKTQARKLRRAHILLLSDEGEDGPAWTDEQIAQAQGTTSITVARVRRTCVEEGIPAALNHKRPCRTRSKVLDGKAEAQLIQFACSQAPPGWEHWTMQLLADKLIELEIVESISDETVRTTLKKTNLSPG